MSHTKGHNKFGAIQLVFIYACAFLIASSNSVNAGWEPMDEIHSYFNLIQRRDPSVFGGAVVGWETDAGIKPRVSTGLGRQGVVDNRLPMYLGTSFRTNVISEMFVAMAVAYLENTSLLPFQRTHAIPAAFLPPPYNDRRFPFVNPHFPSLAISLETLLYHTSTLNEEGFNAGAIATPGPTLTLKEFVEKVFTTQGVNLWTITQPGAPRAYKYSRLNTALASYVIDRVLESLKLGITIGALIYNEFLAPIGLTQTFLADQKGRPPVPVYPEGSKAQMSSRAVEDVDSSGKRLAAPVIIHAAYTADFMYYISVTDLARLGRELFIKGGLFTHIGDALKSDPIPVREGTKLVLRSLGVYHFDPVDLCATAASYCSLASVGSIVGWAVDGRYNDVAFLCISTACAASEVSHYEKLTDGSDLSNNAVTGQVVVNTAIVLNLLLPALQFLSGERPPDMVQFSGLFGLYVCIGVFGAVFLAVGGSLIADYIIQPPRSTRAVNLPGAGLPMNDCGAQAGDRFGALDGPNMFSEPQGIAPPVRRLDVYD